MGWLAAIGEFLAAILKGILPALIKESKKPKDVINTGFDEELDKDFDDSFEEELDSEFDFMSPNNHPTHMDQPPSLRDRAIAAKAAGKQGTVEEIMEKIRKEEA